MSLLITPTFDFGKISHDKESTVHLDVLITAPENENEIRNPLHLVLALDCSGSMNGEKLSSVRDTTLKLIDHLTENDSLAIIGFSTDVWDIISTMSMTQENKKTAKAAVRSIHSKSCTNLSAALERALEKAVISDTSKICRIIVLTDGLPTNGECSSEKLVEMVSKMNSTISITSFGYGYDYDAELMSSIASAGRGSSFFIKNMDDCNRAFAIELGGLLSLYGQNLKITISPAANVEFQELLSDYKCEQKNGYRLITNAKYEVIIDDIFSGEKKHLLLKLKMPKATEAVCARTSKVCDVQLSYTDLKTKTTVEVSGKARIQYVKPADAPTEPDKEIYSQIMVVEAAKIQKEAQEKAEKGDLEGARSLLRGGSQLITDNAVYLGEQAQPVLDMFSNLTNSFSDQHTYSTAGSKLSRAYYSSMTTGRGSSGDTFSIGFSNTRQKGMLDSFTKTFSGSSNPDPVKAVKKDDPVSDLHGDLTIYSDDGSAV